MVALLSHTSCTRAVSVMCALTFLLVATWLLARVLISPAWYWAGAHCSSAADDQWSMHCRLCTKTTICNAPCIRAIHQRRFQRRVPVQIPNVERSLAIFKGISQEQLQHLTVEYFVDVPFQKTVFFSSRVRDNHSHITSMFSSDPTLFLHFSLFRVAGAGVWPTAFSKSLYQYDQKCYSRPKHVSELFVVTGILLKITRFQTFFSVFHTVVDADN